jgi:hypothetical protein
VGGVTIKVSSKPLTGPSTFAATKRYIRSERHKLSAEALDIFWKSATGHVLPKNNKLEAMTIKQSDDKLLFYVKNLNTQLKALEAHCYSHDLSEAFTIVVPLDVTNEATIETETYNLFRDYATLHPAMIANSNVWLNTWPQDTAIHQNLQITFEFIRSNTDPALWAKALEDHDEFLPVQQGGSLILYFVLKRLLDVGESSLDFLRKRVRAIKLTDLPGENVEDAVSLIKSTVKVLLQCSTDIRNHLPDDFPETVLKVFQTSSSPAFNQVFAFEESTARHEADKFGGVAHYPTVTQTCTLALNTYKRFTGPGDEYTWVKAPQQGSAFSYSDRAKPSGAGPSPLRKCFNCGKPNCIPSTCSEPFDADRIKKNSELYRARNPSSDRRQGNGKGKQRNASKSSKDKDEKGRPVTLNKNGVYVVDQRKFKALSIQADVPKGPSLDKAAIEQKMLCLEETAKKLEATASTSSNDPASSSTDEDAVRTPAVFTADVQDLRKLLQAAFN